MKRVKFQDGDRVLLRMPYTGEGYHHPWFRCIVRAITNHHIELLLLGTQSVCGKLGWPHDHRGCDKAEWPHESTTWLVGRTKTDRMRTWWRLQEDPLKHEPTMTAEECERVLRIEGATEIRSIDGGLTRIAHRPSKSRPCEQATATITWVDGDQFRIQGWRDRGDNDTPHVTTTVHDTPE
jgi:hypothetical protein